MLNYTVYHTLHLVFLIIFTLSAGLILVEGKKVEKWVDILHGVASLVILVAGMGLLARLGNSHSGMFPTWVIFKIILWFALSVFIPLSKRLTFLASWHKFSIAVVLFTLTILVVNYKIGS